MSDGARLRVWTLLARVRALRVERARREVSDARAGARQAASRTARQRQAIAEHEAARVAILAACAGGHSSAPLWRMALKRHDGGKSGLEQALAVARDAGENAEEQVVSALHVLQREMRGLDDARERTRGLTAAQQDDGDSDD